MQQVTPDTDQITDQIPAQTLPKLTKNQLAMLPLVASGVRTTDIAKQLGLHTNSVSRAKRQVNKYLITAPDLLKKGRLAAHKILDDYTSGNDNLATQAVRLIDMQQQRIDPIKRDNTVQTVNNYTQYNLSILTQPGEIPQDVVLEADNNVQ
jgi:DNA-binding CsgD family transcriptional regulator